MAVTEEQVHHWLTSDENEHLEFKRAENHFDADKAIRLCCALANEGGGYLVLGVSDKKPRCIEGTPAFRNINEIKRKVIDALRLRVEIQELFFQEKRVIVFTVPSRHLGLPLQAEGKYWMRRGEDLVSMTWDKLKSISEESITDYSAQTCPAARWADLSESAIKAFQQQWARKSSNRSLDQLLPQQLLADAELVFDDQITIAALVLFGKREALGRSLAQSEVAFEYRSNQAVGQAGQRVDYREGFFCYYDDLWNTINLRNTVQHFQDGLFVRDIPTFSERSVREAILNAVSHRDYRHPGSIIIRQYPDRFEITSPGGFPPGVTPQNILDKQVPRNRRIAEAFQKCGLVERSGQGANRMFEEAIEHSKALPDFSGTDDYQVVLTLDGRVSDVSFLKFLETVGKKRSKMFSVYELLVLDSIHRGQEIPIACLSSLKSLLQDGVIEHIGRKKYILSRQYFSLAGKLGHRTRKIGLGKETNRQLLLKHISDNAEHGSNLQEFVQVLPNVPLRQIQYLISTLVKDNLVSKVGKKRGCRYFPFSKLM